MRKEKIIHTHCVMVIMKLTCFLTCIQKWMTPSFRPYLLNCPFGFYRVQANFPLGYCLYFSILMVARQLRNMRFHLFFWLFVSERGVNYFYFSLTTTRRMLDCTFLLFIGCSWFCIHTHTGVITHLFLFFLMLPSPAYRLFSAWPQNLQ